MIYSSKNKKLFLSYSVNFQPNHSFVLCSLDISSLLTFNISNSNFPFYIEYRGVFFFSVIQFVHSKIVWTIIYLNLYRSLSCVRRFTSSEINLRFSTPHLISKLEYGRVFCRSGQVGWLGESRLWANHQRKIDVVYIAQYHRLQITAIYMPTAFETNCWQRNGMVKSTTARLMPKDSFEKNNI